MMAGMLSEMMEITRDKYQQIRNELETPVAAFVARQSQHPTS
jgi:hypothetical protein